MKTFAIQSNFIEKLKQILLLHDFSQIRFSKLVKFNGKLGKYRARRKFCMNNGSKMFHGKS